MALSFDDLPDEAPVPAAQAAPNAGGLSFDDLPDEAQPQSTTTGGMAGALVAAQPAQQAQGGVDPMQLYYGAARSVDNMGLAAGRMIGTPVTQAVDWTRSLFTDQPTHSAQEYLNEKLGQLQARADSLAPRENDSLANKLMNAGGGFAGNLAAMAATGGLSRAPAVVDAVAAGTLPRVLGEVGQAARTMAVPATTDAVNTGHDVYAQTGDLSDALKASAAAGAANVGMGLLPASLPGNLATRLATGAPVGALTGEGARQLRNMALPETMQTPFNAQDAVVNGLTGSVLAGALGRAPEHLGANPRPEPMQQPAQQQQGMPQPDTAPAQPQPATGLHQAVMAAMKPSSQVPTPFAGSQNISPLLDNLGVQGEARTKSLDLLRPAEADIEVRRRGVVTLDEQRRLANLIGLDGAKAQALSRKLGQAFNAEQMIATTDLVSDRLKSVLEQQQRIVNGQASDVQRAQFVQDIGELSGVFGELMGARAESGRALAAQRRQIQDIRQAQNILEGIGGIQGVDDLAAAIGKAVQAGGIGNASKLIASRKPGLFDYYFRAALLSSPRTHVVNTLGNSLTLGNEIIERSIASGIGGAKRAITGGKSGETLFAEPLDLLIGSAKGMNKAGVAAYDAFKTGESAMLGVGKQESGVGIRPTQGLAEKAFSLPYRALGAEDAWFATLNYEGELRALARQQAVADRKIGTLPQGMKLSQRIEQLVQNPTPAMIESAGEHARTNTFNSKAGTFAQAIIAAKAKAPWLNVIAPFVRTPANIVNFGLKRTPFAPAYADVRADIKAGGAKQERAIARILWGSSVMVGAGALAQAGYITGGGPEDKEEKAALMATGWRPYSIKVGDIYHEYSRLDPFAQWLSMAADLATNDYQHKDAGDIAAGLLGSFANATINKTYMSGLSDFSEFLSDPKRNGAWYVRKMAGTLAQPFTLASNIASENDPYARETNSVLDAIKYRVPGLRQDLPVKLDHFGEPVPNRTYPGGPFSIAAPIAQSKETTDPVRLEAARIGWAPGKAQDHFTIKKKRFDLTEEQMAEFNELAGKLTHKSVRRAMQSKGWAAMGDDEKRDFLDAELKKSRTAVRLALLPLIANGDRRAIDNLLRAAGQQEGKK